jgi:hypothetical protein
VALTELLTDFQWDQPDLLMSPTKKPSDLKSELKPKQNVVFLFTRSVVPSGKETMENLFLNIFSDVLHEKFVCQARISLCWVDTAYKLQDMTTVRFLLLY